MLCKHSTKISNQNLTKTDAHLIDDINDIDWLVDAIDEDNRSEAHNYGGATVWNVTTNVVSDKQMFQEKEKI